MSELRCQAAVVSRAADGPRRAFTRTLTAVDILVNNTGMDGLPAPIQEIPIDYWVKMFSVRVHGMFFLKRAFIPMMCAAGGYLKQMLAGIPLARFARPEGIAELLLSLASPRLSFSTGAVFHASGGKCSN